MVEPRCDRIYSLADLNSYPGQDELDITFWLPRSDNQIILRLWMLTPAGAPTLRIDDARFGPQAIHDGPPRWIDYGAGVVPTHFSQLYVGGLDAATAGESYLLVTQDAGLSFAGDTIEEAEAKLWGLARQDAGYTSLAPERVVAGDGATFVVRYTAGPRGLPAGAQIRFSIPQAFAQPQTDDPSANGYLTVLDAATPARIASIEDSIESHEKRDVFCAVDGPLAAGAGFALSYRTDQTYLFNMRLDEVDRRYWYSKLPPLQAAVAISPDRPFVSLAESNGHALTLIPGPANRLHLFLPGRRRMGETLHLNGLYTDRYRNSPPSGIIDTEITCWLEREDGARIPLGSPDGRFQARHRFQMPLPPLAPGVYRALALRTGDGELVARSNPMELLAADDDTPCIYWGEIHAHCEMSDGAGDFYELYRHARDEGRLDFAASADHSCYHSDNEWLWMQDVNNGFNTPGRFVTLNGYEWAGKQVHRNVYTARDRLQLFRGMYPPTSSLDAVYPAFSGDHDVVAGPHGSLAHGLVWEHHDPDVQRFIEIYSMWGASDFRDNPLVPDFAGSNPRGIAVNELLQAGEKLGFTGGGDCHEGRAGFSVEDTERQGHVGHTFAARLRYRCGMTAAVMPALTRHDLIQALRQRHTYATTGARTLLQFAVSDIAMGEVGTAPTARCQAAIHAEGPLARVEIVRDGEVVHQMNGNGALDVTVDWQDPEPIGGERYYYCHLVQTDGQQAWSSPVWVRPSNM